MSRRERVAAAKEDYEIALSKRANIFTAEVVPVFEQMRGTEEGSLFLQNVLQIANEERDKEGQMMLAGQMAGRVVEIAKSHYDNFFLQACINSLPMPAIKFVIDELLEDTDLSVARNQQGVRVLCRLIEQCCDSTHDPEVDDAVRRLFTRIVERTKALACHKYGQYIVSAMCENGRGEWPLKVIDKLLHLLPGAHGTDGLVRVASHHYGCWVVQSALEFRPVSDAECGKVIQLRSRVLDLNQEAPGRPDFSQLRKKDKFSWISKMFRKEWTCCTYTTDGRTFLVHNRSNEHFCINPRCRRPNPARQPAQSPSSASASGSA
jgi:hypothetical protein